MNNVYKLVYVLLIGLMIGCGGMRYSSSAYDDDVAIKTRAMALVQKSNENYSAHAAEVEALKKEVLTVLENEKKRKGNGTTVAMWNEVVTGKGNLFDLLDLWKSSSQLSKPMAEQASTQIERLLNSIADLESYKKR